MKSAVVRACYQTRSGDYRVTVLYSKRDGGHTEVLSSEEPWDQGDNVHVDAGRIVGRAK